MLDQERIPIGKIKQAYELNAKDVDDLVAALWPDSVFPYDLWEKVYASFWKNAASHNTIFHGAGAIPSIPEIDPSEFTKTPLYPYQNKIVPFFVELSRKLFAADVIAGFHFITEASYDGDTDGFKENIGYIFHRLSAAEDELNLKQYPPFCHAPNVTAERFKEIVDTKILSVPTACYAFLEKMFTDTVVVDKVAAVLYLYSCGYPMRREVKGLSHALVAHIIAEASAPQAQDDAPEAPTPSAIIVPRSLWEGKSPKSARDNMRQQGCTDPVIVYVLYNWCGLKNKTQLGKLLGPDGKDDSTYLRLAHRLLAEAATLNIQHA